MEAEDVGTLRERFLDAVNRHDLDAMAACQAGYIHHSEAGDLDGASVHEATAKKCAAFPDLRYDVIEPMPLADGRSVVAQWTMRDTQLGRAFGAAPSGRTFESQGLSLQHLENGLLVEDWEYNDDMAMFEALGFTLRQPEPPDAG